MKSPMFAAVDVAQRTLDIALEGDPQVRQIDNRLGSIRRWLQSLPEGCAIGVEATGNLHQLLVRAAVAAGFTVYLLNARDLAHYSRALGRRAKTDRLDAQLILRYLQREHEHLHPYHLPSARQGELDELTAELRLEQPHAEGSGTYLASTSGADRRARCANAEVDR
jgi:transposase